MTEEQLELTPRHWPIEESEVNDEGGHQGPSMLAMQPDYQVEACSHLHCGNEGGRGPEPMEEVPSEVGLHLSFLD